MAELVLNVSAEKYNSLLDSLNTSVEKLGEYSGQMDTLIGNLQGIYQGPQADKAVETLSLNKNNVETAHNKLETQVQIITAFMDQMSNVDRDIKTAYDNAKDAATSIFG